MGVRRNRYVELVLLGREQGFPFPSAPLPSCPGLKPELFKLQPLLRVLDPQQGMHKGFSETARVHLLELLMIDTNVKYAIAQQHFQNLVPVQCLHLTFSYFQGSLSYTVHVHCVS